MSTTSVTIYARVPRDLIEALVRHYMEGGRIFLNRSSMLRAALYDLTVFLGIYSNRSLDLKESIKEQLGAPSSVREAVRDVLDALGEQ